MYQLRYEHMTKQVFISIWTTIKVNKALGNVYKTLKIQYMRSDTWSRNLTSCPEGILRIKDFMKIKLDASPWQKDYKMKEEFATAIKKA